MKFTALFVSLLGTAHAGVSRPAVTVGLNIGADTDGPLGGLEPKIEWQTNGIVQGCLLEGGVNMTVKDSDAPPSTFLWGKVKRFFPGYGDLSARAELDANSPEVVDLDLRFNGFGSAIQLEGSADAKEKTASFSNGQLVKDIDTLGGILTLNPRYDFENSKANVRVGYTLPNTYVQIDAEKRQLTVAQALSNRDKITPTVNLDGDFSVAYTRLLEDGRLTTTWTPDDSIKLEWSDGVWETTIRAPLEGYNKIKEGIKVNMKRSVGLI